MQYNLIPDSAITASSTLVPTTLYYAPRNARLHYRGGVGRLGGWIPAVNDQHQWLQINFGRETQVTGIATQGFYNALHYVKSYTLQYFDERGFLQQYQTESRTTVNICMGNDFLKGVDLLSLYSQNEDVPNYNTATQTKITVPGPSRLEVIFPLFFLCRTAFK